MGERIRQLEWTGRNEAQQAAAFGIDVFYLVYGKPGDWTLKSPGRLSYVDTPGYDTQTAAKAAAQLDYERRVAASLRSSDA